MNKVEIVVRIVEIVETVETLRLMNHSETQNKKVKINRKLYHLVNNYVIKLIA